MKFGELFIFFDYVVMLEKIVVINGEEFYWGELVVKFEVYLVVNGGVMCVDDFVVYCVDWVDMIMGIYCGYIIY